MKIENMYDAMRFTQLGFYYEHTPLSAIKSSPTIKGRSGGASRTQYANENSAERERMRWGHRRTKRKDCAPPLFPRGQGFLIDNGEYLKNFSPCIRTRFRKTTRYSFHRIFKFTVIIIINTLKTKYQQFFTPQTRYFHSIDNMAVLFENYW